MWKTLHDFLSWTPGVVAVIVGTLLAAAAIWEWPKNIIDAGVGLVMTYQIASAITLLVAIGLWYVASRYTAAPKEDTMADDFSIKSGDIFGSGNRVGHTFHGPVQRTMDEGLRTQILRDIPKDKAITVTSILGDAESGQFAVEIHAYLKAQGFKMAEPDGISQSVFSAPVKGLALDPSTDPINFIVGSR